MSINHNWLRELVTKMEQGIAATTQYTWIELANEVIRLHQGLLEMRNDLLETTRCDGGTDVPYLEGVTAQAEETIKQIDQILGEYDD